MAEEPEAVAPAVRDAIRKEAVQQSAKWIIGAAVGLVVVAATGWWLYFKPMIAAAVGGVPRGAVMAFDRDDLGVDACPPGWSPFLEARARVIVGAGDPSKAPGKMAFDERGERLQDYVLRQHGGQQAFADLSRLQLATGVQPHSNILPYVALYYCKKM
jgi:hypothetical protein